MPSATLCVTTTSPCDTERLIAIAHPCPAASMNEASNSWVVLGEADVPIDPTEHPPTSTMGRRRKGAPLR